MKLFALITAVGLAVSGCEQKATTPVARQRRAPDPLRLALAPHAGTNSIDQEIQRLQARVRAETNSASSLERLGWAFIAKARESFDAGYYKLAEQCALAMQKETWGGRVSNSIPEALLLRGHALNNLHRFKEAELLAREVVSTRGLPCDHGLLADALMEQGRLDEAVAACQRMVDLRPDLHSYARAAHLRWLKGDLDGALELMRMATSAASPRAKETAAWVQTRLATYLFQAGHYSEARAVSELALQFQSDYPPALLLQGRLYLAASEFPAAVDVLQRAAQLNPLPEYEWTLVEALRAADRNEDAADVEARLRRHGAASDPRTLSLFLSTRGESPALAVALAEREFETRGDIFTRDALAWSYLRAGKPEAAWRQIQMALAEGTQDARLFFHAAAIAVGCGRLEEASAWATKTEPLTPLLLPSERAQLQQLRTRRRQHLADRKSAIRTARPTIDFSAVEN
jgi:tetratricopeptide (TPR) repeat protein